MFPTYPVELKGIPDMGENPYGDYPYFCLVGSKGDALTHSPSPCKEYILDYAYYAITGCKSIFLHQRSGLKMGVCPGDQVACLEEVRLVVNNFHRRIGHGMDLLNQVEDHLKIPRSVPFALPNNKVAYVVRGSARWLIAPPMLSFYALLIRSGRLHQKGEKWQDYFANVTVDQGIWFGAKPGIDVIMKHGDIAVFGEDIKKNWKPGWEDIHNRGIQTFGNGALREKMPEWYKLFPERKKA